MPRSHNLVVRRIAIRQMFDAAKARDENIIRADILCPHGLAGSKTTLLRKAL